MVNGFKNFIERLTELFREGMEKAGLAARGPGGEGEAGEVGKGTDYVALRHDRRMALRSQLLVLRAESADKKFLFGYAKMISRSGMFISTVNPKKVDEEFDIAFMLPDEVTEVKCRCRVMWTREYSPRLELEPGMGLKFVDLDEKIEKKIEEWVRKG